MLQKLRDKTSGWIATVILGLLIIPFAFVGIEQYLVQRIDSSVAKVAAPPSWWKSAPSWWPMSMLWQHEDITSEDFRSRFERVRQQRRTEMGDAYDAREFETIENKRAVLETLIDERVQRLAAKGDGLGVSDASVIKAIQSERAFQVDNKFNHDRYVLLLRSQQPPLTQAQFEQTIRDGLQQNLLAGSVGTTDFLTVAETERMVKLLGETRSASLVMLPPPPANTAEVAAADIQKWYDQHRGEYRAPESVSIEYVEVNSATLPPPAAPDEAVLRKRYEDEKARFVQQEQRLASHILVRVDKDAPAAQQKAAEQKAAQLATQAKAPGADFAALAKANSDDTGSKAGGGDLGWVSRGAMVAPFEQALFAMKAAGEVVGPIKTDFGYHVIQLRELKTGQQQSFEQARDALVREQTEADRERAFNDFSTKLVDLVYKNPSALTPAAREVGLPVQKLGPFPRNGGQGIAANPAVVRAAFSDTLIQDGTVSDPIEIGTNHTVLIRVTEHTPERDQPLAEVRDRVIAAIRADRAGKAAEKEADDLLARLGKGETLEAIATAKQLRAPETLPEVRRGMPLPEPSVSEAIFSVPVPAAGKVSPGKARLTDGRVVLFTVSKVTPGDDKSIPPAERETLRTQIAQVAGNDDATALVRALRKRMKVTVSEHNL